MKSDVRFMTDEELAAYKGPMCKCIYMLEMCHAVHFDQVQNARLRVKDQQYGKHYSQKYDSLASRSPRSFCACHGLDVPDCPGERCLLCGVDSPPGHVVVRSIIGVRGDNMKGITSVRAGRVCSSHTLREIILSGKFDLELSPRNVDDES